MNLIIKMYDVPLEFPFPRILQDSRFRGNTSGGITVTAQKTLPQNKAEELIHVLKENFEYVANVIEEHVAPDYPCWCWKCRTGGGCGDYYENESRFIIWYMTGSAHGHYRLTINRESGEIIFYFAGSERSFRDGGEYAAVIGGPAILEHWQGGRHKGRPAERIL